MFAPRFIRPYLPRLATRIGIERRSMPCRSIAGASHQVLGIADDALGDRAHVLSASAANALSLFMVMGSTNSVRRGHRRYER
jgi:hypothetical protein